MLVATITPAHSVPKDATDHPLLSRVAGTKLEDKVVSSFDAVEARLVGTLKDGHTTKVVYEGKVTRLRYTHRPEDGVSKALIYRNHQAAAKNLGGKQLNQGFDPHSSNIHLTGVHVFALGPDPNPPVAVLDLSSTSDYDLTIIEPVPMEQSVKSTPVQAAQLAKDIGANGFTTIHINFDTAKAELKDDGVAAVKEIAILLKNDPGLKLSIEGHTDNVGTPESNKQLSHSRANAVMSAVIAQGIQASRLKAAGHGQEMPVADNRTEGGRAKNRRVELIKAK